MLPNLVHLLMRLMSAFASLFGPIDAADHPNALWHVVHDLCLRDQRLTGHPAPCLAVNLGRGFAVVPDPGRRTQVLVAPTTRISGIESPALLRQGAVNYWQAAWEARRFVETRAGRRVPREDIALAVNSAASRSQDQLHIHVDCVRRDVRDWLRRHADEIGSAWRQLDEPLAGRRYRARRLDGPDLGGRDPFRLLARGDPAARRRMGEQSLAVIAVGGPGERPGFVLLADGGPDAFAESLMDHDCAVLSGR